MVEDVEGLLAVAHRDREAIAGLVVRDGHQHRVVALAPEQPDVDQVGLAVVKLSEGLVHGERKGPIPRGPRPWGSSPVSPGAGPRDQGEGSRTRSSACAWLIFSRASSR